MQQKSAVVADLAAFLVRSGLLQQLDLIEYPSNKIIRREADGVVPRRTPTIYNTHAAVWEGIMLAHENEELQGVS